MAVHFSNHVRRRTAGPVCDVVVEVFLGDDWYEAYRVSLTSDETAFQRASDVGHALIPLVESLERLGIELPPVLRPVLAHCRCRVQNLIFEYRTRGLRNFCMKYREYVDDPEGFDQAIQSLVLRLQSAPPERH